MSARPRSSQRPPAADHRRVAMGMHASSALVWSLYPVWASLFGFCDAVVISAGVMALLSGTAQCTFGKFLWPSMWSDPSLRQAARSCLRRRKSGAAGLPAVIVEDLCFLSALKFLDAVVAGALLQMYPVVYAVWLAASTSGRFRLSRSCLVGCVVACVGAALVVSSTATVQVENAGWRWLAGVVLVAAAIAAIAVKSQEIALVVDISDKLGWGRANRRDEIAVAVTLSGARNMMSGLLLVGVAVATNAPMPASTLLSAALFGAVLAPAGVMLARSALLVDGNLGLTSIGSARGMLTLVWAVLLGTLGPAHLPMLVFGILCVAAGAYWAVTART